MDTSLLQKRNRTISLASLSGVDMKSDLGGKGDMARQVIRLNLSREQLWQWYGHIFVYMACRALYGREPDPRSLVETIQGLGIRLFTLCQLEDASIMLTLSIDELHAMKYLLDVVQKEYESSPPSEYRTLALAHLFACRVLVRQVLDQETEGKSP